jgi:glycosyltransferase involved in cell wall biosynthesis
MNVLQIGSDSIHLRHFCKAMSAIAGDFILVSETSFIPEGVKRNIVTPFRGYNFFRWIQSYRKLKKAIVSIQPELIHIHQINRLAWLVCRIAKQLNIPVISTAWGSDVLLIPQQNKVYYSITKSVLDYSSYVTADSQDMISAMLAISNSPKKYIHLQYGIDPISSIRKQKIIYSNRLHKELYRIDLIIDLFAQFFAQHSDWKLIIGATGHLTESLQKRASELLPQSAYEFIGWVDQETNAKHYSNAQIYVSLPLSDGTSVSLLEAMSANCIPVVSDLEVSREWITNQINGIVYDLNENPFEQAIKINSEKCFLINQELITKHALRETCMKKFENLYSNLIAL